MNRRDFIKTTVTGAALAATPAASAADPVNARSVKRVPIGFLGAVHSHGLEKLKVVLASADWEFVGVHEDESKTRQACEKLGAKLIARDELLQRAQVVAVESAVADHARHALLALNAGRHVHVEKPPADNFGEMREMIALAREKKLLFQTGYMWRQNPAFHRLFDAVREGWLGEVFMVRAFMSNLLAPSRRSEWGQFKGGAMFEQGAHLIDPIVRLLGRPRRVTPFLRRDGAFNDSFKDNNVVVLEFDKCVAVLMNSSLHPAKQPPRSLEVLGSNGTASIRPIEPPALELELVKAAGPYKAGPQAVQLPAYERYVDDFAELARAVRGEGALSVTLEEELLVQETVLRASGME